MVNILDINKVKHDKHFFKGMLVKISDIGCYNNDLNEMRRDMRFPAMWYVRPAQPQISLCILAV